MASLEEQIFIWTQRVRAIAQTGLAFDPPIFDRERYEELLALAAEMAAARADLSHDEILSNALYEKWRGEIGQGLKGYVTPKVGIGAVVFNERDELLLIERPSHLWFVPTGFADIGYTPAEIAIKEVREETGLVVTPTRLIAVYDIRNLPEANLAQHLYSLFFYCRLDGGALALRAHEALNAGFFARDALPQPLARADLSWVEHAFAAHHGELRETFFDKA
jgi:ADP-ribose pyrophosphatase YjhB (NUDIX family)